MTEAAARSTLQLEMCFRQHISFLFTRTDLLSSLLVAVKQINFPACDSHFFAFNEHYKRLFLRLRLHAYAKKQMRSFKKVSEKVVVNKVLKNLACELISDSSLL